METVAKKKPRRRRSFTPEFKAEIVEACGRERSNGVVRADTVHERLLAMGFGGDERTTRRAVAEAKEAWRSGRRRRYRPWVPEPGMWLQFDWGEGPRIGGRRTNLFCAWVAWSRFRVVIPTWDRTLGTLVACLDAALRRVGGAPAYLLTDNEKTVTVEHVAGVAVRHPEMVAAGRHYGCKVETCVPYDPESKGGSESTVKVAKRDLVPTDANLLESYANFAALVSACDELAETLNARVHRETGRAPADMLAEEAAHLHVLPAEAHTSALVRPGWSAMTRPSAGARCATRHLTATREPRSGAGWWARSWPSWAAARRGRSRSCATGFPRLGIPRSSTSTTRHHPGGNGPRSPKVRPKTEAEVAFCALGEGATRWLVEAAAVGAARVRTKMANAVELAALVGPARVEEALGLAAVAGRFGDGDLTSILDHLQSGRAGLELITAMKATRLSRARALGTASDGEGSGRTGPSRRAHRRAAAHAPALRSGRRPRGAGHGPGPALGPRRGAESPARRGGDRP